MVEIAIILAQGATPLETVHMAESRTRSNNYSVNGTVGMTFNWGISIPPYTNNPRKAPTSGTVVVETHNESMTDVVTPNIHSLIRSGEIVNNPATRTVTKELKPVVAWLNHYYDNTDYSQGGGFLDTGTMHTAAMAGSYTWLGAPAMPDYLKTECINEAFSKVAEGSAHILETIAETGKSLSTVMDLLKRLAKFAPAYRRLRRMQLDLNRWLAVRNFANDLERKVARDMKAKSWWRANLNGVRNDYLEFRYGIRPIYYDVHNILRALKNHRAIRETARSTRVFSESCSDSVVNTTSYQSVDVDIRRASETYAEIRSGVLYEIEDLNVRKLEDFGYDEVLETAWALVPYSFIVDWFYDVGMIIAAVTPSLGVDTLASFCKVKTITVQTMTLSGRPKTGYGAGLQPVHRVSASGSMRKTTESWTRFVNVQPGIPLGSSRVKLDLPKVLDIMSIFGPLKGRGFYRL